MSATPGWNFRKSIYVMFSKIRTFGFYLAQKQHNGRTKKQPAIYLVNWHRGTSTAQTPESPDHRSLSLESPDKILGPEFAQPRSLKHIQQKSLENLESLESDHACSSHVGRQQQTHKTHKILTVYMSPVCPPSALRMRRC